MLYTPTLAVIPAKAGIYFDFSNVLNMDSHFRGNDELKPPTILQQMPAARAIFSVHLVKLFCVGRGLLGVEFFLKVSPVL